MTPCEVLAVTQSPRVIDTEIAYRHLIEAYKLLKACGAIHAAARVKNCLKSAEGAIRHARRLEGTESTPFAPKFHVRVHRRPR